MKQKNRLQTLLQLQAVTGQEERIFAYLKHILQQLRVPYTELPHGDIVVGSQQPTMVLSAHVDEIGFRITNIKDSGRCRFTGVGWVYPWLFPGREVQVETAHGLVYGIVVYNTAFSKTITTWSSLEIDFGYDSRDALVNIGIVVGSYGTYKKAYWETNDRIFATSLDNRLSVWMLLNLIATYRKQIEQGTIAFAFTSDEEVENRGAKKTIPWVDPEFVCVVDIMPHSLLPAAANLDISAGPYILNKTLDYTLPPKWKEILRDIPFIPINGKSEYLRDSEPKMFQRKGYVESINLTTIVENYHHGTYAVHMDAIQNTESALHSIIKKLK